MTLAAIVCAVVGLGCLARACTLPDLDPNDRQGVAMSFAAVVLGCAAFLLMVPR